MLNPVAFFRVEVYHPASNWKMKTDNVLITTKDAEDYAKGLRMTFRDDKTNTYYQVGEDIVKNSVITLTPMELVKEKE